MSFTVMTLLLLSVLVELTVSLTMDPTNHSIAHAPHSQTVSNILSNSNLSTISSPTTNPTLSPMISPNEKSRSEMTNCSCNGHDENSYEHINASIQHKDLVFMCHYEDDITEIAKDLTFRDYAIIIQETTIHTLESMLYLPISFESATINELTPWIKAGVTAFSVCHVFSVDLTNNCPKPTNINITDNDENGYFAFGIFQIAGYYELDQYQNKLIEIFESSAFRDKFDLEMNERLSYYTSTNDSSYDYEGFISIDFYITNPVARTIHSLSTMKPTSLQNDNTDAEESEISDDNLRNTLFVICISLSICLTILIGFLIIYYRKNIIMNICKCDICKYNEEGNEQKVDNTQQCQCIPPQCIPPRRCHGIDIIMENNHGEYDNNNNDQPGSELNIGSVENDCKNIVPLEDDHDEQQQQFAALDAAPVEVDYYTVMSLGDVYSPSIKQKVVNDSFPETSPITIHRRNVSHIINTSI